MEPSLLSICAIAFISVLCILCTLAVVIRLLTSVFPDTSPETDTSLMKAIDEAVTEAYPGATVLRVELEMNEDA